MLTYLSYRGAGNFAVPSPPPPTRVGSDVSSPTASPARYAPGRGGAGNIIAAAVEMQELKKVEAERREEKEKEVTANAEQQVQLGLARPGQVRLQGKQEHE